ncbi:MAG: hypothetical protein WCL44_13595 [bacterium]
MQHAIGGRAGDTDGDDWRILGRCGGETIVCVGDSLTYGYLNPGAGSAEGETYPAMLRQGRHE